MPNGVHPADDSLIPKITLAEEDGRITLDIWDGNGNRMKVFLDLVVASRLGQDMAEKARHAVAKASDDKARMGSRTFSSRADRTVSVGEAV